jgi:hypothetical protein
MKKKIDKDQFEKKEEINHKKKETKLRREIL